MTDRLSLSFFFVINYDFVLMDERREEVVRLVAFVALIPHYDIIAFAV